MFWVLINMQYIEIKGHCNFTFLSHSSETICVRGSICVWCVCVCMCTCLERENTNEVYVLIFGESVRRIYKNHLHYFFRFSINCKVFQNRHLWKRFNNMCFLVLLENSVRLCIDMLSAGIGCRNHQGNVSSALSGVMSVMRILQPDLLDIPLWLGGDGGWQPCWWLSPDPHPLCDCASG